MNRTTTGRVGIIGGATVPHAPQFFSLPPTEDHDQVARVESVMHHVGDRLRALDPDVIVILANDHLENHLLHTVPSFMIHTGERISGTFAGREFSWPVDSAHAVNVVRALQRQGFDPAFSLNAGIGYEFGIPLTFLGVEASTAVIPMYVNSYVPPQPSADRCYAFGEALNRAFALCGLRAVLISSGGLSHYPGTDQYGEPDVEHDRAWMDRIEAGNLRSLLTLDDAGLDRVGNVEARSWLVLAGALGERIPDVTAFEPSWHHTYAIAAWTTGHDQPETELHYPIIRPDLVTLYEALYELRMQESARTAWLDDAAEYAGRYRLPPDQSEALANLDEPALRAIGVHPLLGFLARLQVELTQRRLQ